MSIEVVSVIATLSTITCKYAVVSIPQVIVAVSVINHTSVYVSA